MTKYTVTEKCSSHSCDDCGYYSDTIVEVVRDGTLIASIGSDNHLGNGDFDDLSPGSAVAAIPRRLFLDAEVEHIGPIAD